MKISVCVATYNGEEFIQSQLESILHQLDSNDEVIVSDDGSTDNTISVIEALNDTRIKIFHHTSKATSKTSHIRISKNFEYALGLATGEIVFLSDQDDLWQPNKVAISTKALRNCDLVCSNAAIINSDGTPTSATFYAKNSPVSGLLKKLIKINYHGCTMAFRRKLLDTALPFPNNLPIHDGWLGMIAELTGAVCYIPSTLTKYRIHSHNASKIKNTFSYKIAYRLYIFKELYKRYRTITPAGSLSSFIARLNNPRTKC